MEFELLILLLTFSLREINWKYYYNICRYERISFNAYTHILLIINFACLL